MIKELFNEAIIYKNDLSNIREEVIDSWYTIPFYGKVNINGKIILPKKEKLTFCSDLFTTEQNSTILTFDFVANSILLFIEEYKLRYDSKMINGNLPSEIKLVSGYNNSLIKYSNYINSVIQLDIWKDAFLKQGIYSFVDHLPITLLGFLETYSYSFIDTGLEVEIEGFPRLIEFKKNYHKDFNYVIEILAKHGLSFRSETNRIIGDLYSPYFKSKVRNNELYFKSKHDEFKLYLNDFFEEYYYEVDVSSEQLFNKLFPKLSYEEVRKMENNLNYKIIKKFDEKGSFSYNNKSIYPEYYPNLKSSVKKPKSLF